MEPLNDDQLHRVLREWRAPAPPPGLWSAINRRRSTRVSGWRWLLAGSIQVPVPVGLLLVAALVLLAAGTWSNRVATAKGQPPSSTAGFAGFQPVDRLHPVVIRSNYDRR